MLLSAYTPSLSSEFCTKFMVDHKYLIIFPDVPAVTAKHYITCDLVPGGNCE